MKLTDGNSLRYTWEIEMAIKYPLSILKAFLLDNFPKFRDHCRIEEGIGREGAQEVLKWVSDRADIEEYFDRERDGQ